MREHESRCSAKENVLPSARAAALFRPCSSSLAPSLPCITAQRMSSTTVVNTVDRPRPAPAAAVRPVYTGGALARTVTSSQLVPTESLISQRGGATELRERDRDREGLEAGLTRQVVDEKGERRVEQEGGDDARDDVVVTDGKEGVAEEWTFPDGGWRAWSVVFVSVSLPLLTRSGS